MRVELVSHLPKGSISGIGRYVRELHHHLQDHVDVTIKHFSDPPLAKRFPILHNFPTGIENHQTGAIVHFTQIMGCAQMLWRPYRPSVATVHDLGLLVWPDEAQMFNPIDRRLVQLSFLGLKRVDGIIAVSEFTRLSVIEHLGFSPERVWTVYEGCDVSSFHPVNNARHVLLQSYDLQIDPGSIVLLYVGSELPRKNLQTLLHAMAFLPAEFRLIKVGRAGGESFRANTQQTIIELGLQERVVFVEDIPDEDMPVFYSAADIYCSTSFVEGFGLPILEAMACGTPVICSNTGSLPEIAGNAAILISPEDALATAESIAGLSGNQALQDEMSALGLERAQQFRWQQAALDTIKVYAAMAAGGPRRPRRVDEPARNGMTCGIQHD